MDGRFTVALSLDMLSLGLPQIINPYWESFATTREIYSSPCAHSLPTRNILNFWRGWEIYCSSEFGHAQLWGSLRPQSILGIICHNVSDLLLTLCTLPIHYTFGKKIKLSFISSLQKGTLHLSRWLFLSKTSPF